MVDNTSLLSLLYPRMYELSSLYKRYYWQCVPKLPNPDYSLIKDVVKNIKISSREKPRFKREKNVLKKSNDHDVSVKII